MTEEEIVRTKAAIINNMVREYIPKVSLLSGVEFDSEIGLLVVMLLHTYISENHELLGIDGFDGRYAIEAMQDELGETYTVRGFFEYYASLSASRAVLPKIDEWFLFESVKPIRDELTEWSKLVCRYGHALADNEDFTTAHAVRLTLLAIEAEFAGRMAGDTATAPSLAELMVELIDPRGKTVLDFACGEAVVLSLAALRGAARVVGSDINKARANRARIMCFFGNPIVPADIRCGDMLFDCGEEGVASTKADAVFVAPPLGCRVDVSAKHSNHGAPQSSYNAYLDALPSPDDDGFAQDPIVRMPAAQFVNKPADTSEATRLRTAEQFCLARSFNQLAAGGTAIVHTAKGTLFRTTNSEIDLRKRLISNGCVRAVVELPAGAMYGTAIETALVIMGERGSSEDVLLIDMSSSELADSGFYLRGRGAGVGTFTPAGIAWLKDVLARRQEIVRVSKLVQPAEFEKNDWGLTYARYGEVVDADALKSNLRTSDQIRAEIARTVTEVAGLTKQIDTLLDKR